MITSVQKKHQLVNVNGIDYYTIDKMEQVHAEMFRLLKIINKIAEENNISYWIDGGSMIGLLRHGGFIPWDDDLDIAMLKDDYLKLIGCLSDYCKTNNDAYLFFSSPQKYHCCNYFASKKLFYRTQGSPSLIPVKVDIRVYNCIQNTEEHKKENAIIKDTANYILFGKSYGFVSEEDIKKIDIYDFFNKYNYKYGLYNAKNDDALIVPPYFEYSNTFDLNYHNLFPLKKVKFFDIDVPIPKDYDYMLSSIYGDYMKLPSLKHRAPIACEFVEKEISMNFYEKYIHFSFERKNLYGKIIDNWNCIRLLGIWKYCYVKFMENKAGMGSNYDSEENVW